MTTAPPEARPYAGRRRAPASPASGDPAPTFPVQSPSSRDALTPAGEAGWAAPNGSAGPRTRAEARRAWEAAGRRTTGAQPTTRSEARRQAHARAHERAARSLGAVGARASDPATTAALDPVVRVVRETPPPTRRTATTAPASRAELRSRARERQAAKARARRAAVTSSRRLATSAGVAGALALTAVAAQAVAGPLGGGAADADSTSDKPVRTDFLASSSSTSLIAPPRLAAPAPRVLPVSRAITVERKAPAVVTLPGCDGQAPTTQYANGRIPMADLCKLTFAPGHRLRADAAVALARLNVAYKARFGDDLCLTDSYRSFASQMSLAARKPGLAARPGTSEHGWGLAIDACDGIESYDTAQYLWMRRNAPDYGWDNPLWARSGGNRPEPWHWEYVAAER